MEFALSTICEKQDVICKIYCVWKLALDNKSHETMKIWALFMKTDMFVIDKRFLIKIKEKYLASDVILLNENYSWWDNEEDDTSNGG